MLHCLIWEFPQTQKGELLNNNTIEWPNVWDVFVMKIVTIITSNSINIKYAVF